MPVPDAVLCSERNHPFASEPARLRSFGCSRNLARAHAIEVGQVVDYESARLGCSKKLVLEISRELGLFLIQRAKLGLVDLRQLRPCSDEVLVVELDEKCLFGVEAERLTIVVDALHALKELAIEINRIGVRGQLRCFLLLDALECGIGIR